jgi:hypothetical protein
MTIPTPHYTTLGHISKGVQINIQERYLWQALVAHTYNSSYLGGRD